MDATLHRHADTSRIKRALFVVEFITHCKLVPLVRIPDAITKATWITGRCAIRIEVQL